MANVMSPDELLLKISEGKEEDAAERDRVYRERNEETARPIINAILDDIRSKELQKMIDRRRDSHQIYYPEYKNLENEVVDYIERGLKKAMNDRVSSSLYYYHMRAWIAVEKKRKINEPQYLLIQIELNKRKELKPGDEMFPWQYYRK